jgi:hypothetical protein
LNETFQVEFGTPWLKVSGWQRAALAMKEQFSEDLFLARVGLFKAYVHTNRRVQYFFKDAVGKADNLIKEVEKASLGSIAATLQSTEQMISQSKILSTSLSEKIMHGGEKTSSILAAQSESIAREIAGYSRKMSGMFQQQAKVLSNAASSVFSLGQDIQTYRETHYVDEQKQLLKTWWKIFGMPQQYKDRLEARYARQAAEDEEVWGASHEKKPRLQRRRPQRDRPIRRSYMEDADIALFLHDSD